MVYLDIETMELFDDSDMMENFQEAESEITSYSDWLKEVCSKNGCIMTMKANVYKAMYQALEKEEYTCFIDSCIIDILRSEEGGKLCYLFS